MSKLSVVVADPPVAVVEPVSLADVKAHLRVDSTADDGLISGLIVAAREYCEQTQGRAYVTRTYSYVTECAERIELPMPPFIALTSVKGKDADGVETAIAADDYELDTDRLTALLTVNSYPDDAEKAVVVYTAGYGDPADVPELPKLAMKLIVGDWYDNPTNAGQGIPKAAELLLSVDRVNWL